jgi:uncharacterized protein involved in exopolysaccharide biosynthesis
MTDIKFYFTIFLRRLNVFLPVVMVFSAIAVIIAVALPPAYESQMQVVVESPQIPDELAPSTVRIPALEQLEIVKQRLLTRANMLDIARRFEVLPNMSKMNPDEIVEAMLARTTVKTTTNRDAATLMWVTFEAPDARVAAAVLGEYLTLIQRVDAEFRQSRATETLGFFEQQAKDLGVELDALSAEILAYKNANTGALPETLEFRMNQQSQLQANLNLFDRDTAALKDQKERLIAIFEATGTASTTQQVQLSPEKQQLAQLQAELRQALSVFSEQSVKVRMLRVQIEQLEQTIAATAPATSEVEPSVTDPATLQLPVALQIQISEIDSKLFVLDQQRQTAQTQFELLNASIEKTPEVSIRLEELNRQYSNLQQQYKQAQDRLAAARTGELIETRSRGQEISVIEPPAIPTEPTKPNRILIAGGGVAFSIALGLGLVLLLEMMKNAARRPEDLVKRFNIMPIATIPMIQTPRQILVSRTKRVTIALLIIVGVPAAVWAVHTYYLPLDLLAEKAMNKLGVRL